MLHTSNKIALVTGATQGIGLAVATQLDKIGTTVILSGIDTNFPIPPHLSNSVIFLPADISNEKELSALASQIEKKYGRLDYLVANAGVLPTPSQASNITPENISATIDINLKGTFHTLKIFGDLIQRTSKEGAIVTLSSVDGIIGEPFGVIYSATKAGIISFTQSFARTLNNPLVRVNSVAPGLIDTPLTDSTGESPSLTTDLSIIQRIGAAEEVAHAVCFLLSQESSFITGQTLVVDGGFTLK